VLVLFLLWSFSRLAAHYQRLAAVKKGSLKDVLDELLAKIGANSRKIEELNRRLADLRQKQQQRLSRIGLVKFNPFNETGGRQSFVLALMNNIGKGLVLTSFHNRTGTRIYAKIIKEKKPGSSKDLSREEKLAVKNALEETEK